MLRIVGVVGQIRVRFGSSKELPILVLTEIDWKAIPKKVTVL